MRKIAVFVPRRYYMEKVRDLLSTFGDCEILIISTEEKFSLNTGNKNYKYNFCPNFFSLLMLIFRERNSIFDVYLLANIDMLSAQFLLKFLRHKEFHTFDEGHINTREDGKYYIREFTHPHSRRWKILNKIFGFPMPWGTLYDMSDYHYSFFNPEKIKHPLSSHKNFRFVKRQNISENIEKIFLGVNSYWGWTDNREIADNKTLYHEALVKAAGRINSLKPDLYLMHPREDNSLIELLDDSTTVLRNIFGNEKLINSLFLLNKNLTVYTVMSGAIYDLNPLIKVRYANIFDRFDQEHFDLWIEDINSFRKKLNKDSPKAFEIDF